LNCGLAILITLFDHTLHTMLRCATLACGLTLAGSYRVVSKADDRPFSSRVLVNDTQLAEHTSSKSQSLSKEVSTTMRALQSVDPETIAVDLIEGIAGFDFNGNLLEQMGDLVKSSALNIASTIMSSIHPLLGVVFSVFASVFGWGGTDSDDKFVDQILEQVDKMIKGSIRDFRRDMVKEELFGVLSTINSAGSNATKWGQVDVTVAGSFPKVFKSCWHDAGGSECKTDRTSQGGAAALMLELLYTHLMIGSALTVAQYNHQFTVKYVSLAGKLTRQHFEAFRNYRRNFGSSEFGLRKGNVTCWGGRRFGKCETNPSRDLLLESDFCGTKAYSSTISRMTDTREWLEDKLNNCFSTYQDTINSNLAKLNRETKAAWKASVKIEQLNLRRQSDCAEGYELKIGDIGGRGKIDGVGGNQDVNDCNECANLCTGIAACLSYECSPAALKCNLNTQRDPTDPQHRDYAFCSKA